MRKILAVSLFVLATLTWSLAQNPGATPPSAQQPPSAGATQQTPPSAGANPSQPGAAQPQQNASANATITEGCLGCSGTDYTLTDKAGTTYKLNFPATANLSTLSSHVGESVRVLGDVTNAGKAGQSSINATKIGRGTGTCPAASSAPAQPQTPKP